jgi:hypothetical protein
MAISSLSTAKIADVAQHVSPKSKKDRRNQIQPESRELGEAPSSAWLRHFVGVAPVAARKARLKGPSEP